MNYKTHESVEWNLIIVHQSERNDTVSTESKFAILLGSLQFQLILPSILYES